jgi:hypothetical protein
MDDLTARTIAIYVGKETAFNAGPSAKLRLHGDEGSFVKALHEMVENQDARPHPGDYVPPTKGRSTGESKLISSLRAPLTKLIAAASPATDIPQDHVFESVFGGKHVAAGLVLAAGSTTSILHVTSGDDLRAPDGTILSIPYNGVYYRRKVITSADGLLTLDRVLPGAPATGAVVHNSYLYYPTRTNTKSLYAGIVQADESVTTWQWENYAGAGNLSLTLDPGKLIKWTCDIKAARGQGPADYSLAQDVPALVETDPFFMSGATTLFQTQGTGTSVHAPIHKIEVSFTTNNYLKGEHGGTNNFTGVGRNPTRPFCTVKVTQEPDAAVFAAFVARTKFMLNLDVPLDLDTSVTGHFFNLSFARLCMNAGPDYEQVIEGARQGEYMFAGMLDNDCTATTDLATAVYRLALG